MTQERIEEIKEFLEKFGQLPGHMALELLVALEEAQQHYKDFHQMYLDEHKEKNRLQRELAEAQQTIARLESELEEMTEDRNIWRSNSADWDAQEELEEEEGETQP